MRVQRTYLVISLLLVSCGQSSGIPASNAPAAAQASCLPGTPAIAHDSDGNPVAAAGPAPVMCASRTGFGGAETHIRIARDGWIVEEPAVMTPGLLGTGFLPGIPGPKPETQLSIAGLAVSGDDAASWQLVKPGGATWVGQDAAIGIDRATDRLFYFGLTTNPAPQGGDVPLTEQVPGIYAHLLSTRDRGATWHSVSIPGFMNSENPRFTFAPAPAGQTQPVPGENVSYWCGNVMQFTYVARLCYRSFDGGASWQQSSVLFLSGSAQHSECSRPEDYNAGDGNYPQGAADGSLWILINCGGRTFLARSDDEGGTWPILRKAGTQDPLVIPNADELRIDGAGNLYTVHLDGNQLLLRTSQDGGQTWSDPHNMTAPSARDSSVFQWAMAQRDVGVIAVSYLVAEPSVGYDGYVTVTHDALDAKPAFWSAAVNSPDAPLVTDSQQAKDDFIDVDVAPDGSGWAAFYSDCVAADPSCATSSGAPDPLGKATTIARLVF